jgi:hypothetical protein
MSKLERTDVKKASPTSNAGTSRVSAACSKDEEGERGRGGLGEHT